VYVRATLMQRESTRDHGWESQHCPPAAIVRISGTVEELNDGRGRRLLDSEPQLVDLAKAFIECDLLEMRFTFVTGACWYAVGMRRPSPEQGTEPGAIVEATSMEPPYGLTSRELDVLTLMAGGLSNPEIAGHLHTSPRTVSTHVERILSKISQSSRAGAAGLAVQEGLLRVPVPGGGRSINSLAVGKVDQRLRGWRRPKDDHAIPANSRARRHRRPFLIGSALPLDGPAAAEGMELQRGAALAIAEVNARGGIAGRPLEHVVVNADIFSRDGMRAAFDRLIDLEVDAITTGYAFDEDWRSYEQSVQYGCPLLNVMTSENQADWVRAAPDTFGRIFQVGPTEIHYGAGFIQFLNGLLFSKGWQPNNQRLIFVETPVPGGHMSDQTTVDRAERSGWSVDAVLRVSMHDANWAAALRAIRQASPAAVLVAHYLPNELIAFQQEFMSDPTESLIYCIYTPSAPNYLDDAGSLSEGVIWATATGLYSDSLGRSFCADYKRAYGSAPGRCLAGVGYDQVNLLVRAWAHVGNPRAFDDVSAQLRRSTHRGVNGAYSLANDGQTSLAFPHETSDPSMGQAHLVFQVQDRKHRILAPRPFAESTFRVPPWISACA
jgi:branched-chain amino acid transport system substrate-binding protein